MIHGRLGKYFYEGNPELNVISSPALDSCCLRSFLFLTNPMLATEFRACDPWHNAREPAPEAGLKRSANLDEPYTITRDKRRSVYEFEDTWAGSRRNGQMALNLRSLKTAIAESDLAPI